MKHDENATGRLTHPNLAWEGNTTFYFFGLTPYPQAPAIHDIWYIRKGVIGQYGGGRYLFRGVLNFRAVTPYAYYAHFRPIKLFSKRNTHRLLYKYRNRYYYYRTSWQLSKLLPDIHLIPLALSENTNYIIQFNDNYAIFQTYVDSDMILQQLDTLEEEHVEMSSEIIPYR